MINQRSAQKERFFYLTSKSIAHRILTNISTWSQYGKYLCYVHNRDYYSNNIFRILLDPYLVLISLTLCFYLFDSGELIQDNSNLLQGLIALL